MWTEREEPLAIERGDVSFAVGAAGLVAEGRVVVVGWPGGSENIISL
jgi:hypothetical protein